LSRGSDSVIDMDKETPSYSELDRYVCGGYFIAKPASNAGPVEFCEICKAKLPPGKIITLSTCLTATLPHNWAYEWVGVTDEERKRRAEVWGLHDSDLNEFIKWATERQRAGKIGYPHTLLTLDTATDLLRRFQIKRNGWHLLGLGLRRDSAASFVAEYAPRHENELLMVIAQAISEGNALDRSGQVIGYEVLAWEVDGFHSWFCSLSEKDVSDELGIHPEPNGLLDSYEDATKVASAAAQPHDAAPFGPVAWYPWAVVSYPG
jgi:hypothetical protein